MSYPIIPRQIDSSGLRAYRLRYGIEKSEFSSRGMAGWRSTRARTRHEIELSWEGVGRTHLDPIETILDTTLGAGLVVCPSFQREIKTSAAWTNNSADISYDPDYDFLKIKDIQAHTVTITNNVNDKMNFRETSGGAEKTIDISAQAYDMVSLAAAIESAMDAQSGFSNPYTVQYNLVDDRFHISTSESYLELLWFSGTNAATCFGKDIGFDVSRDQTGKTSYKSQWFKMPFGSRIIICDPSDDFETYELMEVMSTDSYYNTISIRVVQGQYEAPSQPASHTYPAGSIIEPVFNAWMFLPDDSGEAVWGHESQKGKRGIVQASLRCVESFNA